MDGMPSCGCATCVTAWKAAMLNRSSMRSVPVSPGSTDDLTESDEMMPMPRCTALPVPAATRTEWKSQETSTDWLEDTAAWLELVGAQIVGVSVNDSKENQEFGELVFEEVEPQDSLGGEFFDRD
jgi:hypothetical protein